MMGSKSSTNDYVNDMTQTRSTGSERSGPALARVYASLLPVTPQQLGIHCKVALRPTTIRVYIAS